jgi:alginate O-acetyltransferase complex protein AlgI
LFAALCVVVRLLNPWPAIREWVIIVASLMVIVSWGLLSLGLLLAVAGVNFAAVGIFMRVSQRLKAVVIGAGITFDVLTLATFKYATFFESNLHALTRVNFAVPTLGIPLAISFYTFHLISYLVDTFKGKVRPLSVRSYLFYLCFFPHVIAGPIVRTWQLVPQLGKVRRLPSDIAFGIHFLIVGFFLKAVVANNIAEIIDPIWQGTQTWTLSTADRWLTAFLYYCQIYSDFAGYTLMALGMARLLGYRLPPNFRAPLIAGSLQSFWRRWHRTLSFWLRDYIYIPLGGNRRGTARAILSIVVTMLLGGLWHGAAWTFVIWGGMHASGIVFERLLGFNHINGFGRRTAWWLCTQIWVTLTWVFFRSPDVSFAFRTISAMVRFDGVASVMVNPSLVLAMFIALGAVIHQCTPFWIRRVPRSHLGGYLGTISAVLLLLNIIVHSPNKVFIYFRF